MLILLAFTSTASAATLRVEQDGSGDYTSIQDAIDAADYGDRIEVGPGEYFEALDFAGVELELVSTDGPELTILDPTYAEGTYNAITLTAGEAGVTRVEGFTLRSVHGTLRHGIRVAYGEVTIVDTRFDSLDASSNGGGILVESGIVHLEGCTFTETRGDLGGAIYLGEGSSMDAVDLSIEGASATKGGGVAAVDSTLEMSSSTLTSNSAESHGGGIWASGATVTLTDVSFESNAAEDKGGAIYLADSADLTLDGGELLGNTSDAGAVLATSSLGTAEILGTEFLGNSGWSLFHIASRGGGELTLSGISLDDQEDVVKLMQSEDLGALVVSGSSFEGTPVFELSSCGALRVEDTSFYGAQGFVASVGRATLSGVTEQWAGDSRFLDLQGGDLTIEDSSIADNSTLELELDTLTVVDSAFSRGSGVWLTLGESATFDGATFEDNTLALDVDGEGELTVTDSVFTGNTGALIVDRVPLSVRRSWFCDNVGAVQLTENATAELSNNVFLRSSAEQDGAAVHATGLGALTVVQNAFLSGAAARYGGGLYVVSSPLEYVNNLVAWTGAGAGLSGNSTAAEAATLGYDAWWENTDADLGAGFSALTLDATHVLADPGLASDVESVLCGADLRPGEGSPLIDGGDPDRLDADGSRSDIGPWGGADPLSTDAGEDTGEETGAADSGDTAGGVAGDTAGGVSVDSDPDRPKGAGGAGEGIACTGCAAGADVSGRAGLGLLWSALALTTRRCRSRCRPRRAGWDRPRR